MVKQEKKKSKWLRLRDEAERQPFTAVGSQGDVVR